MKTIVKSLLIIFTFLIMCSCENWLEVNPKSQVKSSVLFETEQGYKDALIGSYLKMTDGGLYGKELTLGYLDVLAQQYQMPTGNPYNNDAKYEYDKNKNKIGTIWSKTYNIIANINNILLNIEEGGDVMHPNVKNIIKGECLGLRAYLHFDLLRLFTWGNLANDKSSMSKMAIPYLEKYDKNIPEQRTVEEVLDLIKNDLKEAAELLNKFGTYGVKPKPVDFELPDQSKFFDSEQRSKRFNYFAVRATQARIALWEGDYSIGKGICEEIIKEKGNKFAWITSGNINVDPEEKDYTFSSEHIFALDIAKHYEKYVEKHIDPDYYNTPISVQQNNDLFYLTKEKAESLFEVGDSYGSIGDSDYRYTEVLDRGSEKNFILKFHFEEGSKFYNNVPLIKISEIYLIAAECALKAENADKGSAIDYLNTLRRNRNIVVELEEELSIDDVDKEIFKEYRKEFLMEGVLFYYYKRTDKKVIPNTNTVMGDEQYVFPLPDIEVDLGRDNNVNDK